MATKRPKPNGHRVSTEAQDTALQRDAPAEAGCAKFFQDKISTRQTDRLGRSVRSR